MWGFEGFEGLLRSVHEGVVLAVEAFPLAGTLALVASPAHLAHGPEVAVSKFNGLKQPSKGRAENKIDGPIAGLMGTGRMMADDGGAVMTAEDRLAVV